MTVFRLSSMFYPETCCCPTNRRLSPLSPLKIIMFCSSPSNRCHSTDNDNVEVSSKIVPNGPKPPWRIMFFGSDSFAVESLKVLCSKYRTGTIIETLDVSTTFNQNAIKKNSIYEFAQSEKLTLFKWPPLCDNLLERYDLGVVVSFGHLIPSEIIKSFPLGILNVHASLLPKWRGAAPIIRAIMNGDTETGITIMKIESEKFDIGNIVRQYRVAIHSEESAEELTNRLAKMGGRLLMECVRDLPRSVLFATPQPNSGKSYAKKVSAKDAEVDWSKKTADEVFNMFRALNHIHPLTTWWYNHQLKLLHIKRDDNTDFSPVNKAIIAKSNSTNSVFPGLVEFSRKRSALRVQCKDGRWICISTIRMPAKKTGKTCLTAVEFFNGYMSKVENTLDRKFGPR